jgi:3'(2'), 5'-bisphosphate nucleotidase
MIDLPPRMLESRHAARVVVAINATRAAGAALMELRGHSIASSEQDGGQLKTSVDLAAEGWVIGFLQGSFPGEAILAEEQFEQHGQAWEGAADYWTVDALDGTRSYMEGFDGFCVQVAWVEGGIPLVGVICEPVTRAVYVGVGGEGAWRMDRSGWTRLHGPHDAAERAPRFVDSTRPGGAVGDLYDELGGTFVECGSVGLKICRVVEDRADIYAKSFEFKLWDVAPGEVLLREVGAVLSTWDAREMEYTSGRVRYRNILAAARDAHSVSIGTLGAHSGGFA